MPTPPTDAPDLRWSSDRTLAITLLSAPSLPPPLRTLFARPSTLSVLGAIDAAFSTSAAQLTFPTAQLTPQHTRDRIIAMLAALIDTALTSAPTLPAPTPTTLTIPICFDAPHAPDLAYVAAHANRSLQQTIDLLTASTFTAEFLGFSPGFAYLSGLPAPLHTPRQSQPRTHIPPGTLAIAADRCAIYPSGTPGGWNLVGRTPLQIFDPLNPTAPLIPPLSQLRFRSITQTEFDALTPRTNPPATPASTQALHILNPGTLATLQDFGLPGFGTLGIPPSGAADRTSLIRANRFAGNPDNTPAIEFTHAGLSIEAHSPCTLALGGPPTTVTLQSPDQAPHTSTEARFTLQPGDRLTIQSLASGCRGYLAPSAGFALATIANSGSTHTPSALGGFHGRALRSGDLLPLNPSAALPPRSPTPAAPSPHNTLRITPNLQSSLLSQHQLTALAATIFQVDRNSNRSGLRLTGPTFPHTFASLPTEPTTPGAVQLPPNGLPIILGPDGPVTGGYPVIGVVIAADLPLLGQFKPGDYLRFQFIPLEEAWSLASQSPFI